MRVLEFGARSGHIGLGAAELDVLRSCLRVAADELGDDELTERIGTSRTHVESLLDDLSSLRTRMRRLERPASERE